jgi:hypothetical protein
MGGGVHKSPAAAQRTCLPPSWPHRLCLSLTNMHMPTTLLLSTRCALHFDDAVGSEQGQAGGRRAQLPGVTGAGRRCVSAVPVRSSAPGVCQCAG